MEDDGIIYSGFNIPNESSNVDPIEDFDPFKNRINEKPENLEIDEFIDNRPLNSSIIYDPIESIDFPIKKKEEGFNKIFPFNILRERPEYIPELDPPNQLGQDEYEIWVQSGFVNNVIPSNMDGTFVISQDTYIALKIDIDSNPEGDLSVLAVNLEFNSDESSFVDAPIPPPSGGVQQLPAYVYLLIGLANASGQVVSYINGSVSLYTIVSNLTINGTNTTFKRQVAYRTL